MWWAGWAIISLLGLWFVVRCAVGLAHISRDQPYPRPQAWLI